jgi:hypothetical protein
MEYNRMVYNIEFPNGKEVPFTSEEITAIKAKAIISAEEKEAFKVKLEKAEADKASGNQKLKDLGLTDDEIAALIG